MATILIVEQKGAKAHLMLLGEPKAPCGWKPNVWLSQQVRMFDNDVPFVKETDCGRCERSLSAGWVVSIGT